MNNNISVSKEESVENMKEDFELIKFVANGIETGNPEVINNIPFSALRNACNNSQPNNQENEMNPERLIVFQGSDLNTNISNDQRILNNIQPHTSPEYETGKEGQFPFYDKEVSDIGYSITRGINEPKIYQTMYNNQVCGINSDSMHTSQDLLQNSETGNKTPCMDILSILKNNTVQSDLNMANKTYACNWKRIASYYEALRDNSQGLKRSEDDILKKSGQYFPTYSKEGSMNYDLSWKKSSTNQMAFENRLTSIDNTFQTIKESPFLNQGMQVLGNVDKNALFTVGHTIASNTSISEIAQNDHEPSKISDPMASNCSRENMLVVPGRYSYHTNVNNPNLCTDNALKTIKVSPTPHTSNLRGEIFQSFNGRVCKVAVAEHATEENTFKCRNCSYTYCKEVDLQIHSYTHVPKTTCEICGKEHAVENSHNSEHKCADPDCTMTFYCRTRLYEHFLVHIEYFEKNCWVCRRKFCEHITEKDSFYICCVCGFQSIRLCIFESHNRLHLPRFFCKLCKEEYSEEEKCFHGSFNITTMYNCFECPIKFKCTPQLEEHYENHHGYSSEKCRICKGNKYEHFTGTTRNKKFQCCKKECLQKLSYQTTLSNHLFTHTGLRDFKCHNCGRRFILINGLKEHKRFCKALPFKCELCETKFHSSDILREHFLLKHRQA